MGSGSVRIFSRLLRHSVKDGLHLVLARRHTSSKLVMARLVAADWLRDNFSQLRVLDCHFNMEDAPAGHAEYSREHIPGAAHFAIERSGQATETVKRAFLPEAEFAEYVRSLGVRAGDDLVLYDRTPHGLGPAARAWFLFHVFGQEKVAVLEGGLKAWKDIGGSVTDEAVEPAVGDWKSQLNNSPNINMSYEEFVAATRDGSVPVLDARPPQAFAERHVRGAKSLPAAAFFRDGRLLPKDEIIRVAREQAGLSAETHPVTYCNSAMGSSTLMLILNYAGIPARNFNGAIFEVSKRDPNLLESSAT